MPLLTKNRILGAAIETTAGTAESLDATDAALNVYNPIIQPNITVEQRQGQAAFNKLSGVAGMRMGTCTFRTDLWWDGTSTMPAWAETFLPACGWVKSSTTYAPVSQVPGSSVKTLTLGCYVNGLYKQIHGAMGNFNIVLPTGRLAYIDWTFTGVWDDTADVALVSPTYPTDPVFRVASTTTTFNSNAMCFSQISFNSGNRIVAKECSDNVAGIDYFLVADRTPTATASPEAALKATTDHYGDLINETEAELSVLLTGGTGNDTLEFEITKAQIVSIAESDRNGIVTDNITWQANKNGTTNDDELAIIFSVVA